MRWIKIKDRLPDKEGFYIVRQKGGYVTQLKFRPDVKLKEDDIWTFNILSEWLDESASLPSSSVTGESEAIGERTFSLKEIQDILDDYCKVLLSDISNTFLRPENQAKAAMLSSSAVFKAIGEKITTFPLPDIKQYFKDKFGIEL